MIKKLVVNDSRGGTGKSYEIVNQIKNSDGRSLYLAFNKSLREKFQKELRGTDGVVVHTVHSLSFSVLKSLRRLPDAFSGIMGDNDPELEKPGKYKLLIEEFLTLEEDDIRKSLKEIDNFFVDEFQDLSADLLLVIEQIVKIYELELLCIAGDRFQKIYKDDSEKDLRNNFDIIPEVFGKEVDERIHLRTNYRTENPKILKLLNTFILSDGNAQGDVYTDCQDKYKIQPVFRLCENQWKEFESVLKNIQRYGRGKDVAIISAHKVDLQLYEKRESELSEFPKSLKISTIHSFKGLESEVVFLIGFQFQDDWNKDRGIKHFNINYVGISRAQQKLFISSSYPTSKEEVYQVFSRTVEVVDKQSASKGSAYKKLRKLRDMKNYVVDNLNKSAIDSIKFRVTKENAPFYPYVGSTKTNIGNPKITQFMKTRIDIVQGVEVVTSFHYMHGNYYFENLDLNKLKMNGYTDLQIIYFLRNIVREYFDYRIPDSRIQLYRIDICKLYPLSELEKELSFIDVEILNLHSIVNHEKREIHNLEKSILNDETVYLNFHKKRGVVISIYFPSNKVNPNRIPNKDIFKIEYRYHKPDIIQRNYAFGTISLSDLISELKADRDYLEKVRERTLKSRRK